MYQSLLLSFGGNIEGGSEKRGVDKMSTDPRILSWQSLDQVLETEVVSTDPEPKGEDDAICVQCVQTME